MATAAAIMVNPSIRDFLSTKAMAGNMWCSLVGTAAGSRLSSSFSNHLLGKFGTAISNNFCTIVASETSNNLCTIRNNSYQQQQQQSSLLPVLMLPSLEVYGVIEEDNYYEGFFCVGDGRIKRLRKVLDFPQEIIDAECKGSSKGWLAFVSHRNCRMFLVDLFSSDSLRILELPSIFSLPRFKEAIPILGDPSSSASGTDVDDDMVMEYKADGNVVETFHGHMSTLLIKRLALSSNHRGFIIMVCSQDGHGLSFCREGDPVWTPLVGSTPVVEDILYSKKDKLFYSFATDDDGEFQARDFDGNFQAWDFNNADGDGFPKRIDFDFDFRYRDYDYPDFFYERVQNNLYRIKYYLVESPEGHVLFLARHTVSIAEDGSFANTDDFPDDVDLPVRTAFFSAFKLDFEKQIGVPVKSLGDAALFVGLNESFSLSTRDHPKLMANSIYFADDNDECIYSDSYSYGGDDMGVYNFEDYSISPLYHPFQFKKIQPPPIWVSRARP